MINSQRDAISEQIFLIKPRVDHNWLDLGCGKGKIIPFIKKYNPKSYLGLDVDVSCLVKCLKFHDEDQDVFIFNKCNLANNWDDTNGQWFSNTKIKYDYIIANFSLMHFFTDLFWEQLDQYVSIGTKFIFNLVSKSSISDEWSESNSFLKIVNDQVIYKFEWIHDQIKIEPFISEDRVIKQLEKSNWKVVSKKIGDSKHELSKFYTWWVIEKI
jgi:SAM-dependent methyltransferase